MATVSPTESILDSIKLGCGGGIKPEYTNFDDQLIPLINTTFSVLTQLGVGPKEGFSISDRTTTWDEYLQDNKILNMVITYIQLSVNIVFDQPANSFVLNSMKERLKEYEWRINMEVDP